MATGASFTTDDKFKKDVLNSDKPVLLDFGAKRCGHCRKLSPIVDKIAHFLEVPKNALSKPLSHSHFKG